MHASLNNLERSSLVDRNGTLCLERGCSDEPLQIPEGNVSTIRIQMISSHAYLARCRNGSDPGASIGGVRTLQLMSSNLTVEEEAIKKKKKKKKH